MNHGHTKHYSFGSHNGRVEPDGESKRETSSSNVLLPVRTNKHRSVNQHTNPAPSSTVTPSGDCLHDCPLQGEATPAVLCWRAETSNTH